MDRWNDRLEAWVQTHPWSWGTVGALFMGALVLSLQVLFDGRTLDQAAPTCAAIVTVWFVLLGVTAKRRAR